MRDETSISIGRLLLLPLLFSDHGVMPENCVLTFYARTSISFSLSLSPSRKKISRFMTRLDSRRRLVGTSSVLLLTSVGNL
ncbi:hypothetical protein FA10DRAFT_152940 [Acaromyces ingoldii]|uniref:Secreted protein n=1 Tax=Acaromyces ingoldii TaxID=215250 RepID=A0A316YHE7_9BASI|nr:hypothetical protein FA10DRAFT_152940 [Acaromyces ingoldii]PWN88038.1 hypothetical protein FA10DRAFT_152940 [Acaromyces ingoldii]